LSFFSHQKKKASVIFKAVNMLKTVTDGIDRCRVGFLKRHMVKHAARYDGLLAQVTRVFSVDPRCCDSAERRMHHHTRGCCFATIISCSPAVSCVKGEGKDNNEIGKEIVKRKRVD